MCIFHIDVSFSGEGKMFGTEDKRQKGADETARGAENRAHEFTCSESYRWSTI